MLRKTIKFIIKEFFDHKLSQIGLITAQNPQENQADDEYNHLANKRLLDDINTLGFEPFPTYYYGEDGYLIPGISRQQLIDLGKKYNQKAVIWGKRMPEDRNKMTFEWEYLEDGKIRGQKISHHPFICPDFK